MKNIFVFKKIIIKIYINKMRPLIVIIVLMGATLSACHEDFGLFEFSEQDEEALLGLQQEMSYATSYNDSLKAYFDLTGIKNDAQAVYFDEHYHYHDSLFSMHDNNYSHLCRCDDHMGNGGMMGQNNGYFPNDMGHYQSDHDFMDSLHVAHEPYHPL